jgi:hypothetical protein
VSSIQEKGQVPGCWHSGDGWLEVNVRVVVTRVGRRDARRPIKGLAGRLWIKVVSQSGLFLTREINQRNTPHCGPAIIINDDQGGSCLS